MRWVRCGNETIRRGGHTRLGGQRWRCDACRRRLTARSTSAFSGRRFPDDVIALVVRWYARFRLSYADVAEWLAERGFAPVCHAVPQSPGMATAVARPFGNAAGVGMAPVPLPCAAGDVPFRTTNRPSNSAWMSTNPV